MFQIVYLSSATVPFSQADLATLLVMAQAQNRQNGVTGMLVFCNGQFLQALEGQRDDVIKTYNRIENDPRHRNLKTLHRGMSHLGKVFGDWSMGFQHEMASAANPLAGVVRVNNQIDLAQFDAPSAVDFLAACAKRCVSA